MKRAGIVLALALLAGCAGESFTSQDEQFLAAVAASPRFAADSDADRRAFVDLGQTICRKYREGNDALSVATVIVGTGYSAQDGNVLLKAANRVYCPEIASGVS